MRMRKLKPHRKFKPLPTDDGDEFYPNGVFEFNITKLVAFIRANVDFFPLEEVEVEPLKVFTSSVLNESTIQTADLANPIVLAEISPGRFSLIDGHHRLEKAHRNNVCKLPAYRVRAEQHIAFLKSERAYKAYIKYWNNKIDDRY